MKISFIVPGRNNLKYFKWSYDSIMKNKGNHEVEICFADDASTDGTWDWVYSESLVNPMLKVMRNEGDTRLGHTILYDALIRRSLHDICIIWHCDMYLAPKALDAIEKHIEKKVVVSLTRVEPPLHPAGHEKITSDFGTEPETFKEDLFLKLAEDYVKKKKHTTNGVFAPWAFYKEDFLSIGGHDSIFYVQSKEDSDIWNRLMLNGVSFIQTWEGFVYHMTCRGSRFNPTITKVGQNSDEWEKQNTISTRNFIRKWGGMPLQNEYHAIIPNKKYNIGIVFDASDSYQYLSDNEFIDVIGFLEIFSNSLYVIGTINQKELISLYKKNEQLNTLYDLDARINFYHQDYILDNIDEEKEFKNDIILKLNKDFSFKLAIDFIQKLPHIIENYGPGLYGSDIGTILIKNEDSIKNASNNVHIKVNNFFELSLFKESFPESFSRYSPVLEFLKKEKECNYL